MYVDLIMNNAYMLFVFMLIIILKIEYQYFLSETRLEYCFVFACFLQSIYTRPKYTFYEKKLL
jgi:hypothetical protein